LKTAEKAAFAKNSRALWVSNLWRTINLAAHIPAPVGCPVMGGHRTQIGSKQTNPAPPTPTHRLIVESVGLWGAMITKKLDHLESSTDSITHPTREERQELFRFEQENNRNLAAKRLEDDRAHFVGLIVKIFFAYVIITGAFLALALLM
jgi:hypothetical protein